MFCVAYLDHGYFKVQFFNKDKLGINLDVNSICGIDSSTIPIIGFQDPIINACFTDSHHVFINLFHQDTTTNWHFLYDIDEKKVCGKPVPFKF